MLALATAVAGWLAAPLVATALLLGAGLLALVGRNQLARAAPPTPDQAIEGVKTDIEEVRAHARTWGRRATQRAARPATPAP